MSLHNQPKRLIGDSSSLRARFRREHPDVRIETGPRSVYRAWLNARRRDADRLKRHTTPKRLPGDNPLPRAAFARHWKMHPSFLVGRRRSAGVLADYADWLHSKGIDPQTGAMTPQGLAFFEELVAEQNARNRAKRPGNG